MQDDKRETGTERNDSRCTAVVGWSSPLGSGSIESANTFPCHGRLKRSGARWYEANSHQMLALRQISWNFRAGVDALAAETAQGEEIAHVPHPLSYTPITCLPWLEWERSLTQYYGSKGCSAILKIDLPFLAVVLHALQRRNKGGEARGRSHAPMAAFRTCALWVSRVVGAHAREGPAKRLGL